MVKITPDGPAMPEEPAAPEPATPEAVTPDDPGDSGRRLATNTMSLVTARIWVAVLGWGGTVLIARELGQEAFGQFTLVFSLLGMLSIVTDLGVGRVAVASILSANKDTERAELAGTYILLRTFLGIIGYAIALIVVFALDYPPVVRTATAVGGLVVLLSTPSHAYDLAFQVRNRLHPVAVANVVGQMAQLALTIALVLRGGTLVWLTVPAVLNELVVLAWKVPASHRLTPFKYRINFPVWKSLLREAVPLTAGAAFVTLYYRVDSIMLSKLEDFEAVGVYGVAYKFVDLVHFVPTALTVAILAPLTAAWPDEQGRFGEIMRNGARMLLFAGAGAMVGFWLFAGELAELLYGERYAGAGPATRIVVTAEFFGYFSALAITALIAADRHRIYPLITLTGLVINVGANLILIPKASIEGAAVATLLTEAVVVFLLALRVRRLGIAVIDWPFALGVAGAAITAFVVGGIGKTLIAWPLAAVASGVVFLVGSGFFARPAENDWRTFFRQDRTEDHT